MSDEFGASAHLGEHRRARKPFSSGAGKADQPLVYSERCDRLSRALAELPYEQREAVLLKMKQNMTLREIAKLQGVSVSTVHGRYRYGLEKLRALLDSEI